MVNIIINDKKLEVSENYTVLDVAKQLNIHIPTLCHLNLHSSKMNHIESSCRVCMVELTERENLVPACSTIVYEGMSIKTDSKRVIRARKQIVELLLSNHPKDCITCPKNENCELQSLANEMGIDEIELVGKTLKHKKDLSNPSIVRDLDKCVLCGRCENICHNVQSVGIYARSGRGFETTMTTAFNEDLGKTPCTFCGACVSVCPTAALTEFDNTENIKKLLRDKEKFVVVQTAPAVRSALGELFGLSLGTNVTGKMVASLRKLGFNMVLDTDFGADLTVVEETNEFIDRVKSKQLPLITSCCPGWINFLESNYPDLLKLPSTCKSPHEMFGAIAKTYLADKAHVNPENMVVVSVMPCVAKKYEANRLELKNNAEKNVDYVITTRELAKMIKEEKIDFCNLKDEKFDKFMGKSSGAGVIFGVTGGVLEAVVRNANYLLSNSLLPKLDFKNFRGIDGIKEATFKINKMEFKVAIVYGLGNARILLDKIKNGELEYHAIEIMACPGGCIGGGGQPYYMKNNKEILEKRSEVLYQEDKSKKIRLSVKNPEIRSLYKNFLGDVGSSRAHELLHTKFKKRK